MRSLNELGHREAIASSNYVAVTDTALCTACGICVDRCQVKAIDLGDSAVINDRCIGCGLCIGECPSGAIKLARRSEAECETVPKDEKEWMKLRNAARGRGNEYKKLFQENQ